MKKLCLFILILFLTINITRAQTSIAKKTTISIVKPVEPDGMWDSVPGLPGDITIQTLYDDNGTLTVGGTIAFPFAEQAYGVAQWNGRTWDGSLKFWGGYIIALQEYKGNLYAGGHYLVPRDRREHGFAEKIDGTWLDNSGISGIIYSFAVFKNELYAAGNFYWADKFSVNCIAKWDGNKWLQVGRGISSGNTYINPRIDILLADSTYLYAGGKFDSAGGKLTHNIARWDGKAWSAMDSGIGNLGNEVWALAIYKGELYAAGDFMIELADSTYTSEITKWNGLHWGQVGGGLVTNRDEKSAKGPIGVRSLAVYDNELYAAGGFDLAEGKASERIARWNGSEWHNAGNMDPGSAIIVNLCVYKDALYAAGSFDCAFSGTETNHIHARNLAKWKLVKQ